MTDETENLVLELLRGMRGLVDRRSSAIEGSLAPDMDGHDTRIAALEGTPV